MRKKTSIWASFLGALLALVPAWASAAAPTWTLTWSDEFNAANGTAPDPTRWGYDLGAGGWGNGELEDYTNSTSNSYQDGSGHLIIQALNSGGYTSARLKSAGLFNQAYGRVEASMELPAGTALGSGLWPAFWMLGNDINSNAWPACGEIDIMENIGQYNAANVNLGHLHGPVLPGGADYYGGGGVGTAYSLPAGQATNTAYHLYAVEWNPTSVTFYVDGVAYQTLSAASLPSGGKWVFNHPFFIILNLAVGGAVGGPVTASFPQQLKVDYVRVYKLTTNGATAYGGTAATVPGTIQAENYDTYNDTADPTEPAEGFGYNDLETANQGGQYRTGEGVDIEACSDTGGGYDLGWTGPGEWLQYSINCTQAGSYDLTARVAALGAGGTLHVDIDGVMVGGEMTVPNTGGWQTWTDVTQHGIALTAGAHQMLVVEDSLGTVFGNINYFKWSLPADSPTVTPAATATPVAPSPTKTPTFTRTITLTATKTWTATATASATLSPTITGTRTASPSPSATGSASPTSSSTASVTPSSTATPSRSATQTPAPSASVTATGTITLTATPSMVAVYTPPPATPTPTCTATRHRGGIVGVSVGPNPGSGGNETLSVKLDGTATQIQLKVYTRAYRLVRELTLNGNYQEGWNQAALPALNVSGGIYFLQVSVGGKTQLAKLMILR